MILSLILSRLDLKYLCQCSLVSKYFASIIYQIKAVSLTLPSAEILSDASASDLNQLFPNLAGLISKEAVRFIQPSSIKEMKFLPFLVKFSIIKSISLEFRCSSSLCSSSLFNMSVKFTKEAGVMKNFVSVVADHVRMNELISGTCLHFGCCAIWLLALCLLIKCQPSLERITITNGKKQEELVLEGEQLVAWRNRFVPIRVLDDLKPYGCVQIWRNALHMPVSGYLLKGVDLVVAKVENDASVEEDATNWEYKGVEELLAEAVGELRAYSDPFLCHFADILDPLHLK